ncbi:MAG: transposase [Limnochordia bacterium]|jgi:transposase
MSRKTCSLEEKLSAVKSYLEGKSSLRQAAQEHGVDVKTIRQWVAKYRSMGEGGLAALSKNTRYSHALKIAAVDAYLAGEGSLLAICERFRIRSEAHLAKWIKEYNGHDVPKPHTAKGRNVMTKGRKTTFEERVAIVEHCIEYGRDFGRTAEEHKVSYHQVYSWVKKCDKYGINGLNDGRGGRKREDALTDVERLKLQNKMLEAKAKRLEMENELLKKVREIERGRY